MPPTQPIHTLIIGLTPARISAATGLSYTHATWHRLHNIIQSYLMSNPSAVPVTDLSLGWSQIAAEAAQRLNRPFICHSLPHNTKPPKGWYSPDKMVWINAVQEAIQCLHRPWPLEQTDQILLLDSNHHFAAKLEPAVRGGIPILNCWPDFIKEPV